MTDSAALRGSTLYAEDITVGQAHSLGSYTVTEEEILEFAQQWDPQWFHLDVAGAEAGVFGGLIASGLHTMAVYQKLMVAGLYSQWNVIAGKNLREVKFLRPVRPGDTLTGTAVIDDVVLDNRSRGQVTITTTLTDDTDNRVLSVSTEVVVHARPDS
ncbi:acyl dehydratase [Rhodococcus sp. 27YEA15]|uniref:MaoC/PaaZ C-terminal domain-containing protein n=1 Tax=Rhodococcus sp. 27YEA15 TaxID=3156259 RepID=UPI003C7B898F